MRSFDSRTGIERLDRDECLRRLEADEIGRLAFNVGGSPVVVPVNYRMDGDSVVFRTDAGMKLDMGRRAPVSFEIDSFDREHRSGWSVVVTGWCDEVTPYEAETYKRLHELPIDPWARGDKEHWMQIRASQITGRRVAP
jgi:nitroimidazol reductase NimA-like FMN-containing flavoprotein (pyridoxamine 5'-phosphate oxidase superfamily)